MQTQGTAVTERDRIIASMSDAELVLFHATGGKVPRVMVSRLDKLLAQTAWELTLPTPKSKPRPKPGPPVVWPKRMGRKRKKVAPKLIRRRRLREAA